MKLFRQSGGLLLRKVTPLLKWTRWLSELTNYFKSKRPPTQRYTGVRGWVPWLEENPHAISKRILCMLLSIIWKVYDLDHGHCPRAFRCSNILARMGLKSIYPWCLKLGNTGMIVIHLSEVHYRMAIVCDICQSFAGMNTQSVLDHCSGCKAKQDKKHAEHEGQAKANKLKGGMLVTQLRGYQRFIKSRMLFNTFCLVQPENISQFTS